eukprot:CAMPEP_0181324078 /NCGR_PEP_ID=MMETSP1101-20121128/20149_1 /TAXON_ID=46948 /ORGANISM="Rhodomonas abbreviata, Strain Caron Lab Isolate" /LENGTH=76 /DNA_ID=CAMNT_0023432193 /DNA_START=603 /DNA_END=833 /DNA_ORIENTATION=-
MVKRLVNWAAVPFVADGAALEGNEARLIAFDKEASAKDFALKVGGCVPVCSIDIIDRKMAIKIQIFHLSLCCVNDI